MRILTKQNCGGVLLDKILSFIKRYREQVLYLIFGVLTTAVDQVSFMILLRLLPTATSVVPAVASWIIAVSFAYTTNRKWVFRTQSTGIPAFFLEAALFYIARVFSLLITVVIMWMLVDRRGYNADLTKLASGIIVVILNYVLSKFWVFKRQR